MIRRKIYVISDLHFGFKWMLNKRIKDGVLPVGTTLEKFEEIVIKNWNSIVKEGDLVIFLGDLTSYNKFDKKDFKDRSRYARMSYKNFMSAFETLKKLNGDIIWIAGNHDRPFMTAMKERNFDIDTFNEEEYENFRMLLSEVIVNYENDPIAVNNIIFSHEQFVAVPEGSINYHGHIHIGATNDLISMSNRHKNVNVELTGLKPVEIEVN